MKDKIESECIKLFGECPLSITDIAAGKSCGYSFDKFICEAARKYCLKTRHDFVDALYEWMQDNKPEISREEALKRNKYFKKAQGIIISGQHTMGFNSIINWLAFPDDNPEICFYLGYSHESELCSWARTYIKNKKTI